MKIFRAFTSNSFVSGLILGALTLLVAGKLSAATVITVTEPNGGENYQGGFLDWNNSLGGRVKVELLKNGMLVQTINSNKLDSAGPNFTFHSLSQTLTPGTDYRIRVSEFANAANNDTSDADFSIQPFVNISDPFAGESLARGRTHTLFWDAFNGANVSIDLRQNSLPLSVITASTTNDNAFDWVIPANQALGTNYEIRITCPPGSQNFSDVPISIVVPSVSVSFPNTAAELVRGTSKAITWSRSVPDNFKVELLKNGVLNSVLTTAASGGIYFWNIPANLALGNDYKIRVTSFVDGTLTDSSDENFTIADPSVVVTAPNGGETLNISTVYKITWTQNYSGSTKIELFKGGTLHSLIQATAFGDEFDWSVPNTLAEGNDYKIKLTQVDGTVLASDSSDANFSIASTSATVTSPNGGEVLTPGDTAFITWTSPTLNSGTLTLGLWDGTATLVRPIATGVSNNGFFPWLVPTDIAPGSNYKIKVANDFSDNPFTMAAYVTVTYPIFGELGSGAPHTLTWNSNAGGNVKIEVFKPNAQSVPQLIETISASTPNNGSIVWNNTLATAFNYELRITVLGSTPLVVGSSVFSVAPKAILVSTPNGGETLVRKQSTTVFWNHNVKGNVKIELVGVTTTVLSATTPSEGNNNFLAVVIPASVTPGAYRIKISSLSDATVFDSSDADFNVVNPLLTVTQPNTAVTLRRNHLTFVSWNPNFSDGNVKVELLKNGVVQVPAIADSVPISDTAVNWTIPLTQTIGTDYRVRVTHLTEPTAVDDSDVNFSIAPIGYTLSAPNGGEFWQLGSVQQINWTSDPQFVGMVKLELYKGGSFLRTISASANNFNNFSWTIPEDLVVATDYRVRITSLTDSAGFDESNLNFEITPKLGVLFPNGGENLPRGTTQTITWISALDANKRVRIELLDSVNGSIVINADTPDDGSFDWAIPQALQDNSYKVRITRLDDANITDTSNQFFSIGAKSLEVVSPSGQEEIPSGFIYKIRWYSNLGGTCKIELLKGGAVLTVLAPSVANPLNNVFVEFDWNVTQAAGTDYRVRISHLTDVVQVAESSSDFSIQVPSITVTQPALNAQVVGGNAVSLGWTTNIPTLPVKIVLVKGGVEVLTIDADELNDGSFGWTIPFGQTPGADYQIKISTQDNSVTSTGPLFSIAAMTLTVNSPNGGERWSVNTNRSIVLNTNGQNQPGKIQLLKNGVVLQDIFANVTLFDGGSYSWAIPANLAIADDYRVRVSHTTQAALTDDSDANFSIVPRMQVTAPISGLLFPAQVQTITWNSGLGGNVKIDLLQGGAGGPETTLFASTPNDGTEAWTVPANITEGFYAIRVTSLIDNAVTDTGSTFQIRPRQITVNQPFAGDYARGFGFPISWTTNFSGNVKIELVQLDAQDVETVVQLISASAPNVGAFSGWIIPANLTTGPKFKIKLSHLTEAVVSTGPLISISNPALAVSAPNGGEQLVRGTTTTVFWNRNFGGSLKVDLLKGGSFLQVISADVGDNGGFSWTIPNNLTSASDYTVRVSTLDNGITDVSNASFSIIAHNLTVTKPNGAETYSVGTAFPIEWTSNFQGAGNVKIELLKGGSLNTLISASIFNSHNSSFAIPANQALGTDYRVRVTSVLDGSAVDTSNADFEIRPNQAPVANAGVDQTIKESRIGFGTATVSGVLSTDDGSLSPLTYTWSKGGTLLGTGQSISPELALGDHTLTLTVNDGQLSATDDVVIHVVANAPPVANAGLDQTVTQSTVGGASVTVSGNMSTDDGSLNPLTFLWKEGATTLSTQSNFQGVYALGQHTLTLTVSDGQYEASDTVVVNVLPVPNLTVNTLVVPSETFTGLSFDVSWTITNTGLGTATGPWADNVYLSEDDQPGNDIFLGTFDFTGTLAAGQSVTRTQVVKVNNSQGFQDIAYRLLVNVDGIGSNGNNRVNEGPFENDNLGVSAPFNVHPLPLPDLIVESITASPVVFSGQTLTVEYVVLNQGTGGTDSPLWYDLFYLSVDGTPDEFDLYQLPVANVGALAPGERYTGTFTVTLPTATAGPFNIIVVANDPRRTDGVLEEVTSNNSKTKTVQIDVPSTADLQVTQASGSEDGFSGLPIILNWTVENKGAVPAVPVGGSISDRIYLSANNTLNTTQDILLDSAEHRGEIAVNEGYVVRGKSVTLPNAISGQYFIFIVTDSQQSVFEHAGEGNNSRMLSLNVIRSPEPDLIVEVVNSPATAQGGKDFTLNWTVKNQGGGNANSIWTDTILLSLDQTLSQNDITIGSFNRQGLAAGSSYIKSGTVTLAQELSGEYFVLVLTDNPGASPSGGVAEFDPGLDAEANNLKASASKVVITWTPPDLQVTALTAPASGLASKYVDVTWKVKNTGLGDTCVGRWTDNIYVSPVNTLTNAAVQIGNFEHVGLLLPGEEYMATRNVRLPINYPASSSFIIVKTDFSDETKETGREDNNIAVSAIATTNTPPDLAVSSVTVPPSVPSGKVFEFSWVVRNEGTGATLAESEWIDQVYLSKDGTIDTGGLNPDIRLSERGFQQAGVLAINGTYSNSSTYKLPYNISGTWYLIAVANDGRSVFESSYDNNTKISAAFEIVQSPAPDLTVSAVTVLPTTAQSGQFVDVTFTVINSGTGETDPDTTRWFDQIAISRDLVLDPSDVIIGESPRSGGLTPGGTYQKTVNVELPRDISGPYNIFVTADARGRIFEGNDDNNNRSIALPVTLAPPADFVVDVVSTPVAGGGFPGEFRSFAWTVSNVGLNKAEGTWTDNVYLSLDTVWDFQDALIASVPQNSVTVQPNASYSESTTVALPAVLPGNYYVIVRSDIRDNIRETDNSNNKGTSALTIAMDVPELQLGVATPGILSQGTRRYYKVNAPANADLLITLDSDSTQSFNDLVLARNFLPTEGLYEFSHDDPYLPDQQILLPEVTAGFFYILVRGNKVPEAIAPFTITAKVLEFSIVDVTPNRGSNAGRVTTTIRGSKFTALSTASLVSGGVERPATRMYFTNGTKIHATFDLNGLSAGQYDVRVSDQGNVATLVKGFTVTLPSKVQQDPVLSAIFCPTSLRVGTVASLSVGYANTGENDLDAPLFKPFADFSQMRLLTSQGFGKVGDSIIGINFKGPAGILPPGSRGSISYAYTSTVNFGVRATHTLPQYTTANALPMDWKAVEKTARPASISDATWTPLWANFLQRVGPNYGGLIRVLDETSTGLSSRGQYIYRVADLFQFALNDSLNNALANVSGRVFLKDLGHPLKANEKVTLSNEADEFIASASTRGDGSFIFDRIPPGTYALNVEGYRLASPVSVTVAAIPLTLPPIIVTTGFTISGTVRDSASKPVGGALVSTHDSDGNAYAATSTATGTYKLTGLPGGKYDVSAGLQTTAVVFQYGKVLDLANPTLTGVDFILTSGAVLSGVVKSSAAGGGAVIASATVSLIINDRVEATGITETDGSFEISGINPGTYTLVANATGKVPKSMTGFVLNSGQLRAEIIELDPGAVVTATVTYAGQPIENAQTFLLSTAIEVGGSASSATGTVVYGELGAGTYTLKASHPDYGSVEVPTTVALGEQKSVTLEIPLSAVISGTVSRTGGGVWEKVVVVAVSQPDGVLYQTLTDQAGAYSLKGVPTGAYFLLVQSNDITGLGRRDRSVVGGMSYTENFAFGGGSIKGTTYQSNGVTPVADAFVAVSKNGILVLQAQADENGKYCFVGLGVGNYQIEAFAPGVGFDKATTTLAADQNAVLNLLAGTQRLVVNLKNAGTSQPLAGGSVSLVFAADHQFPIASSASAGSDGQAELESIFAGNYTLIATAPGRASVKTQVTVLGTGSTSMDVALPVEAVLTVNVKDSLGAPLSGAAITLLSAGSEISAESDTDGTSVISNLAAGTYAVRAQLKGYLTGTVANVSAPLGGATVDVTLTASVTSLDGLVKDSSSMPVAGVSILAEDGDGNVVGSATSNSDGYYNLDTLAAGNYRIGFNAFGFDPVDSGIQTIGVNGSLDVVMISAGVPDPFFESVLVALYIANAKAAVDKFIMDNNPKAERSQAPSDPYPHDIPPFPEPFPCIKALDARQAMINKAYVKNISYIGWQKANTLFEQSLLPLKVQFLLRGAIFAGNLANCYIPSPSIGSWLTNPKKALQTAERKRQTIIACATLAGGIKSAQRYFLGLPRDVSALTGWIAGLDGILEQIDQVFEDYPFLEGAVDIVRPVAVVLTMIRAYRAWNDAVKALSSLGDSVKLAKEQYLNNLRKFLAIRKEYFALLKDCKDKPPEPDKPEPDDKTDECELGVSPPGKNCDDDDDDGGGNNNGGPDGGSNGSPTDWRAPRDPNEKRGPAGFGPKRFISGKQALTYTVLCENVATSTAPVQKLTIDDQMDANLDVRTFRIKEIVLGDKTIPIPDNSAIYTGRVQLGESQGNIFIDIFAGIDVFTGKSFLKATATDPETGDRPRLPDLGFMPPNDASHRGEGHIVYSVTPKRGLATGSKISNVATIIFDALETIETNTVENTLDTIAPVSALTALAAQADTPTVQVAWAGSDEDGGSGLLNFDIYLSDNNGAFTIWQSATTETSATFSGVIGHTYRFFSIARDNVGNVEDTPLGAETQITFVTHVNRSPTTSGIADISVTEDVQETVLDLSDSFDDLEDDSNGLTYAVIANSNPALFASTLIDGTFDLLTLDYSGVLGESTLTVRATDSENLSVETSFKVTVSALPKIPPAITSKLIDSATAGAAYTYTLTATGGTPVVFKAENLPPGLVFAGALISGTPTQAGSFDIALTATNAHGVDTKTLKLTVLPLGGVNLAPVLASAPTFAPSAPVTGSPVTFTASATDPNNDALTYAWDFGDGTVGSGAVAAHIYSVSANYTVKLVVSDGALSVTATLQVPVSHFEVVDEFINSKASFKFSFASANKDSLLLGGTVPIPAGFKFAGTEVRVFVGSKVFRKFTLDAKGKAAIDKNNTFKLAVKSKKGVLGTTGTYAITLKNQNLLNDLKHLGFEDATVTKSIQVPCFLAFDKTGYSETLNVQYKAKAGKTGAAK